LFISPQNTRFLGKRGPDGQNEGSARPAALSRNIATFTHFVIWIVARETLRHLPRARLSSRAATRSGARRKLRLTLCDRASAPPPVVDAAEALMPATEPGK